MKKYLKAIERRLNLPKDVKKRVMTDLESSIAARREAGQTDETIMAELGTPKEVAAELNEQMKEFAYGKSPWRWAALAAAVLGALLLIYDGVMGLLAWLLTESLNGSQSIGIIGSADGPTAVFVTSTRSVDETFLWIGLILVGALGFWKLSRCKKG